MKFFTKKEMVGVGLILVFIGLITLVNLRVSLRRARDAQRRADISALTNSLNDYRSVLSVFPPSADGLILACKADNFSEVAESVKDLGKIRTISVADYFPGMRGCVWRADSLANIFEPETKPYMQSIVSDPVYPKYGYYYFSNSRRFQIYAYLEGEDGEVGFNDAVIKRGIMCGTKICNTGIGSGDTPLDKSIEEYENELLEKINMEKVILPKR